MQHRQILPLASAYHQPSPSTRQAAAPKQKHERAKYTRSSRGDMQGRLRAPAPAHSSTSAASVENQANKIDPQASQVKTI